MFQDSFLVKASAALSLSLALFSSLSRFLRVFLIPVGPFLVLAGRAHPRVALQPPFAWNKEGGREGGRGKMSIFGS